MAPRQILITGATDGIGKVTAHALAAQGACVWVVGRQAQKTADVVAGITAAGHQAKALVADLSLPSQVKRLAAEVRAQVPRLDVLINNAGGFFHTFRRNAEGFEQTWALNHLNYFLLTHHLLPHMAPQGRIVNVASAAHRNTVLDFDDLQNERPYRGWKAYQRSKLANILFTRELARRLGPSGVTANSLHPGFVASSFGHNNAGIVGDMLRFTQKLMAISPERGAKTTIYLAASPEVAGISGLYFRGSRPAQPSAAAQDGAAAARLWAATEALLRPYL